MSQSEQAPTPEQQMVIDHACKEEKDALISFLRERSEVANANLHLLRRRLQTREQQIEELTATVSELRSQIPLEQEPEPKMTEPEAEPKPEAESKEKS